MKRCQEWPCPELIPSGTGPRCAAHAAEWQAGRVARGLTGQRGTSGVWRRIREKALKRDRRRCVTCGATSGLEVHHRNGKANDNRMENLVTLCRRHHLQETAKLRALARVRLTR